MREHIASIEVKVDREFGIMDIGKKVGWDSKIQAFKVVEEPTLGYTVVGYSGGCLATVDFTPINAEMQDPTNWLKTAQDVYAFFDHIETLREKAKEMAEQQKSVYITVDE